MVEFSNVQSAYSESVSAMRGSKLRDAKDSKTRNGEESIARNEIYLFPSHVKGYSFRSKKWSKSSWNW